MNILARSFYQRSTEKVAYDLIGKILFRRFGNQIMGGIIIETESYGAQDDPASHAYVGKTARNQAMFGMVGCAYVYQIYGMHFCFNIVARRNDVLAGGVLIRAIKPIKSIILMEQFRGISGKNLTNGPAKVAQALHITKQQNGIDITNDKEIWLSQASESRNFKVVAQKRIGICKAQEKLWRFILT